MTSDIPKFGYFMSRHLLWGLYGLLAFLPALLFSWICLSKFNFLYPLWYDIINIDQTVAQYGPQNLNRQHFELTTKRERVRLFSAINEAIHHSKYDFEGLVYHNPIGQPMDRLLTSPEIIHLKDVAQLVRVALSIGWIAFSLWLVVTLVIIALKHVFPPLKYIVLWGVSLLLVVTGLIAIFGAKSSFYLLHQWIFPAGHPWFFYYQDSLMTTMMKAPDLFGYIATTWILLAISIWILLIFMIQNFQRN